MPGLAFLFKKKFHPLKYANQEKVYIAEQTIAERNRLDEERRQELAKETETREYEKLQSQIYGSSTAADDSRYSSLKFMYCQPKSSKSGQSATPANDSNGDQEDPMVVAFREKMQKQREPSSQAVSSSSSSSVPQDTIVPGNRFDEADTMGQQGVRDGKDGRDRHNRSIPQTRLERETGKRRRAGLTQGATVPLLPLPPPNSRYHLDSAMQAYPPHQ